MSPPKKDELSHKYYYGENAEEYANSKWMARLQIKTSERVFGLLEDPRIGGRIENDPNHQLILDLGCGTGYSSVVFEDIGYNLVGIDLSFDMLLENLAQQKSIESNEGTPKISRNIICAAIQNLPIRQNTFNHIISISAFNFILDNIHEEIMKKHILHKISENLSSLLQERGRIIIEFYPKDSEIDFYLEGFKIRFEGGLVIDNPKGRKEQKYLILRKK